MANGKTAFGFIAALVIGGGGGYALGPVADSMAGQTAPAEIPNIGARRVKVMAMQGEVKLLAPDGGWRPTRLGEAAALPTGVSTGGLTSFVETKLGAQTVRIGGDARLLVGDDTGSSVTFQLDNGHLLLRGGRGTTFVPGRSMRIAGSDYGVWAEEDQVVVAVIGGEVEITHRGETTKYAKGREIVYTRRAVAPRAMEAKLALSIVDESKRGRRKRVTLQTTPAAFVYQKKKKKGYERVSVPISGRISLTLSGPEIAPGEVLAFDAAGRIASLGATPAAVKALLTGEGQALDVTPAAAPPPPERKVKRPKPLVKPEAKVPALKRRDMPPIEDTLDPVKKPAAKKPAAKKPAAKKPAAKKPAPEKKAAPPPAKAAPKKAPPVEKKAPAPEKKAPPPPPADIPDDDLDIEVDESDL